MPIPLGILAVAGAGGGGLASSFDLLETTVLSSSASSVTFSSLGSYSDYKHLQIRMTTRNSRAVSTNTQFSLTFNGDTGSNYAHHILGGTGGSVYSTASTSQTAMQVSSIGNSATANIFSASIIDILDFNSSSKNKTIRIMTGIVNSADYEITLRSGFRNNTAAITSFTITANIDNILTGSRFSLYGIK